MRWLNSGALRNERPRPNLEAMQIPNTAMNLDEGTVEFTVATDRLLELPPDSHMTLFSTSRAQHVWLVEWGPQNRLRFFHARPDQQTRLAELAGQPLRPGRQQFIAFAWSADGDSLYCGEKGGEDLRKALSSEIDWASLVPLPDGTILRVGDEGVEVGYFRMTSGGAVIAQSSPIQVARHQIETARVLVRNSQLADFLFESSLIQQVLVLLVTTMEVYCRERVLELHAKGIDVDLSALLDAFIPANYRNDYEATLHTQAESEGKSALGLLLDDRKLNFQNWKSLKKIYAKGLGVSLVDVAPEDCLERVRQVIRWRHKVIHASGDHSILDEEPDGTPIFSKRELGDSCVKAIETFLDGLHTATHL